MAPRYTGLAFILFCAAANFFELLIIFPKFERIYADMFAGLSGATPGIVHWRIFLLALASIWPAAGIFIAGRYSGRAAGISILMIFLAQITQIGLTTICLFLPLIGTLIQGLR